MEIKAIVTVHYKSNKRLRQIQSWIIYAARYLVGAIIAPNIASQFS
jgi:hypothetical protein